MSSSFVLLLFSQAAWILGVQKKVLFVFPCERIGSVGNKPLWHLSLPSFACSLWWRFSSVHGIGFAVAGLNEKLLFRDFSAAVVSSVWWCSHVNNVLQFMMIFTSVVAANLEIFHQDAGDKICHTKSSEETMVVPLSKVCLRSFYSAFKSSPTQPSISQPLRSWVCILFFL